MSFMNSDEFRRQMLLLSDQSNPNKNDVMNGLKRFSSENVIGFLSLCAELLLDTMDNGVYVMCFSAVKDTLSPKRNVTIDAVRKKWLDPSNEELAQRMRTVVTRHLCSECDAVRNLAAATTALLLWVEGKKWEGLIPWLVQILANPQSSPVQRVGAITAFHEILILPIFAGVKDLPPALVEFLRLLTVFLGTSDVPLYFLKKSAACLLDTIRTCPSLFDDRDRIDAVLSVYPCVLGKADKELYIVMHEVLAMLMKEFYPKIDCFMEKIFELVVTGIKSRKEMAVISIDVFRSLCNFERSLPEAQRKNYSEKTFELAVSTAISLLLSTPPTATEDMDPGTAEQEALSVLSEFCLFCPTQMIEGPQTNKAVLVANMASDNWVIIHASLYVLAGMCKCESYSAKRRPPTYQILSETFPKVLEVAARHPVPRLVYEALFVMKRMIKIFANCGDSVYTDEILELCLGRLSSRNGPILMMSCRVLRTLVVCLPPAFTGEFFKQIADAVVESLRNQDLDVSDTLAHQTGLLQALVKRTPKSKLELVNNFMLEFVLPSVKSMKDLFQASNNREQRLIYLLRLLCVIVDHISLDLSLIEQHCDMLFGCLTDCLAYRDGILFSEVLAILSLMCQRLQDRLRRFSGPLMGIVHTGLTSRSPEMTKAALLLYGDIFCKVDGSSYGIALNDIKELLNFKYDEGFQNMIAPIVYALARVFEVTRLDLPTELADEMISLADNQLSAQSVAAGVDKDTLKENYEACFLAYKVRFDRTNDEQIPPPQQLAIAKKLLVNICGRCYRAQAWSTGSLFNLCKFLGILGVKFKARISNELNNRYVKLLLKEGEKSQNRDLAEECRKTLKYVAGVC